MKSKDSAICLRPSPLRSGVSWGFLGVAGFALTVPSTRIAVEDGHLPALFVGAGRAVVAGALGVLALSVTRQPLPSASQWVRIAVVAAGIVIGFPLLTTFALTETEASHGAVIIAVLPAATATTVVLRTRESTTKAFWFSSLLGAFAAVVFALTHGGQFGVFGRADGLLFAAVVVAAIGYAEGGLLARELGAWQTTCWALTLALPVMTVLTSLTLKDGLPQGSPKEWVAFAFLALVSMFLAFFAWYHGLALGPMSTVSQIQLTQPVMSICWAAILLGETITLTTVLGGLTVILCAAIAVRARASIRPSTNRSAEERPPSPACQASRVISTTTSRSVDPSPE